MQIKNKLKIILLTVLIVFLLTILFILFANWRIESYTQNNVFDQTDKIPHNKVGLLLGTSKKLANGWKNLYFHYRIEAAVELYQAKKIDFILVSGDNGLDYYNEPLDMQKALMEKGVPEKAIILDYAGFRTLDSVVRSLKVFGQSKITVISQKFHNQRAIYIAQTYGMEMIGFNAQDVGASLGFKTQVREKLARVKVFLDLFVLNTQPKFLGEMVKIGE